MSRRGTIGPAFSGVAVAALLGGAPTRAPASTDELLRLDLEGGYACFADRRRYHGMVGALDVGYVFHPFWVVRGGYGLGMHQGKGLAFEMHRVSAGLRYQLDVFEYVPWIELSPGAYLGRGDEGPPRFTGGAAIGLGFDWLIDPLLSIGVGVRHHRLLGEDRFPAYFDLVARLGARWALGDPFAP